MAPEDLLLAARDVMRERGLARHALSANGAVCFIGALNFAVHGDAHEFHGRCDAYAPLSDECDERFGMPISIANNYHIATVDEACDVLEAAAKRAAQGGEPR